jgi:hypothetical protein
MMIAALRYRIPTTEVHVLTNMQDKTENFIQPTLQPHKILPFLLNDSQAFQVLKP